MKNAKKYIKRKASRTIILETLFCLFKYPLTLCIHPPNPQARCKQTASKETVINRQPLTVCFLQQKKRNSFKFLSSYPDPHLK
jgi:hypothetical protein